MPTKEELERENATLRDRVAELEASAPTAPTVTPRPGPRRPQREDGTPILSAGELDDLRNAGVTTSPFSGETLNALDEGVEPANPDARRNAEQAQAAARKRAAEREPIDAGDTPAAE